MISDIDCFKPANGETIAIKTTQSKYQLPFVFIVFYITK